MPTASAAVSTTRTVLADVGRGQDVRRGRGAGGAVDVGARGAGVATALPGVGDHVGGGAQVPVVAVSVSPDLAVPAMVGGVVIAGPPAPVALVLKAATATMAACSARLRAGGNGRRAFIGDLRELRGTGARHTVAPEMRAERSRTRQVFVRCFFHPHVRFAGESRIREFAPSCSRWACDSCWRSSSAALAGGLARAALERHWPADGHGWPWVTFAVNLAGTALLASCYCSCRGGRRSRPARAAARHRPVRRADDVLDPATRDRVLEHAGHAALGVAYGLGSIGAGPRRHTPSARSSPGARAVTTSALVWVGVALVSGAGACLRFLVDLAVQRRRPGRFPLGILVVNGLGAFTLGVLHGAGVTGDALLLSGPPCSAPSRRSRPGWSRASASPPRARRPRARQRRGQPRRRARRHDLGWALGRPTH